MPEELDVIRRHAAAGSPAARPATNLESDRLSERLAKAARQLAGDAQKLDDALARERERQFSELEDSRAAFEKILAALRQDPPDLQTARHYALDRENKLRNLLRHLKGDAS